MASRKIGTAIASLEWGVADESWGYVKDVTFGPDPEIEEVKDGSNDTRGLIISDEKIKVAGTYEPIGGTGLPTVNSALIGSQLTLKTSAEGGSDTETIIVTKAEVKRAPNAKTTMTFEGHTFPNIALT